MNIPKIQTAEGKKPVTVVPDKLLLEAYLEAIENAEEKELVELLRYAEPSQEKAASILRQCLTTGRKLVAVYPGLGEKAPQNATRIGCIIDGGLYLV